MGFFANLRQSSYATRRNWLLILSISSGAVLVAIWSLYLGSTINFTGEDTLAVNDDDSGFFQTFTAGVRDAASKIKGTSVDAYGQLKDALETTNEIEVDVTNHE